MLKKLRIKFIALNMATVAVVLAVIFSAICVINYQQSVASVHEAMSNAIAFTESKSRALTDGDAQGQEGAREQDAGDPDEQADGDWKDDGAQHGTPPQIGGGPAGNGPHVPVAVYRILKSGSYELAESAASASIADDVLEKAISQLADAPDGSGELSELGLFYEKRTSDTGIARVAFADVSSANGWQTLALTLAGVGVVALAVFFVISVFFSRWALRPVKRAWEQQRQFVADASHELKTPLTVILANTSILMSHPERTIASQSQWVESTQAEGERMQGLVADLLLLARLDAEETDIVKSKPPGHDASRQRVQVRRRQRESARRAACAEWQRMPRRAQHGVAHPSGGPTARVRPLLPCRQGTHKRCRRLRPGTFHREGSRRRAWRHDNREEQRRRGHHLHSNPADCVIEYLKVAFRVKSPHGKLSSFLHISPSPYMAIRNIWQHHLRFCPLFRK